MFLWFLSVCVTGAQLGGKFPRLGQRKNFQSGGKSEEEWKR